MGSYHCSEQHVVSNCLVWIPWLAMEVTTSVDYNALIAKLSLGGPLHSEHMTVRGGAVCVIIKGKVQKCLLVFHYE